MGMFDDVVVNAKSAANAFSKKAGNICDISKLKFNASSIRGEINKKYQELGEMTYDSKCEKEVSQEVIDAKVGEIKALKEDLAAVNELLATAKNLMICPACSAVISKDSQFCSKCGIKIEKPVEETDETEPTEENPQSDEVQNETAEAQNTSAQDQAPTQAE